MKKLTRTLYYLIPILLIAIYSVAVTTNYTTFVDGNVLNAADLNGLETHYTDADNAILNGDTFTGNMNWNSGVDALFYSDTGATLRAAVYGDSGEILGGQTQQGAISNCGTNYTSGTYTIRTRDGSNISATDPCLISVRSDSTGQTDIARFIANVTATDGAASQTDGNTWGIQAATIWSNPMPFFIGVIDSGTNNFFTFSRLPIRQSGTVGQICQLTDTSCDEQGDVMIVTTGLTLASYTNKPITQVGWFRGTHAAADNWTFSESVNTGFNDYYEKELFDFPPAQMGGASGSHLVCTGGTVPIFNIDVFKYKVSKGGEITNFVGLQSDGGAQDGVGAFTMNLTTPFDLVITSPVLDTIVGMFRETDPTNTAQNLTAYMANGLSQVDFRENAATTLLQCGDFINGDRNLYGTFIFPAM